MSALLQSIDSSISPLVDKMQKYFEASSPKTGCLYDADWGGLPSQAIVNRIYTKVHGIEPKSHWVTYDKWSQAASWLEKNKFEQVILLDYEPHSEIEKFREVTKRVGIFGHHKDRKDVVRLAENDSDIAYFNPIGYMMNVDYERGAPIAYALMETAKKFGVSTTPVGEIGMRAYGYKKLWDEMILPQYGYKTKRRIEKLTDNFVEDVNLLIAWNLDYCPDVVRTLTDAKLFMDLDQKGIRDACIKNKLNERRNKDKARAITKSEIIGDVSIYPIRTRFQTIKPLTSALNRARQKGSYFNGDGEIKLKTTICLRKEGMKVKVSIRTDKRVDLPLILEETFDELPNIERNYGAHAASGGFVCPLYEGNAVLTTFLRNYFYHTGQKEKPANEILDMLRRLDD